MGDNVAVIGRRIGDALVGGGMLCLAVLIIAKLQNEQVIRSPGPFTVIDGDTLAQGEQRLRIRGLDAPELGQMCERPSGTFDCGMVARAGLIRLLEGRVVECFGVEGDEDRYGRVLVTCRSGDFDLGRQLVSVGLGVSDGDYQMAERQARDGGHGIWAGAFERPEDWRRRQKLEAREPGGWFQTLFFRPLAGWIGRDAI